jgi:hypothetical protein
MTTRQAVNEGIPLADFWAQFPLVDVGGRLVHPTPHREQARYVRGNDLLGMDGRRLCPESFLHWAKKTAKSFTAGVRGVHHLVADPFERQDRRVAIASFDEDQSRIIFGQAKQIVERHPWLREHVRLLKSEMVYVERVRDLRTGGSFSREHLLRALPRDLKGTHGENWSLIIRDELWTEPDHAFSESLVISPTRTNGEILYLSYHAPRTMMKTGAPFYDVLTRAQAGDPRLFYSYIGGTGDDAPQNVCPWITDAWIAQQEKILAASPARFRRIILNVPAGPDDGLITLAELNSSLVPMAEPEQAEPGITYWCACDLGVLNDWSCVLVGHLDDRGRLVLDVIRTWRGSHGAPVSLIEVQEEIVRLHGRFHFERLNVDQWQARQMVEQLDRQRVPAFIVTLDGATLDRLVTQLKSAFTRQLVRIPDRATDVMEQLESVQAVEAGRRRDLLKFQPGTTSGNDVTAHDDIAVTLAMLLDMAWPSVGRIALPIAFRECYRAASVRFDPAMCFLVSGNYVPPGNSDPSCAACAGWQWARRAFAEHRERGGEPLTLREWRRRYVGDNEFTSRIKQAAWEDWYA